LREKWLKDARAKMAEQLEVEFSHVEMIAGALSYSKYPLPLKWIMRKIAKTAGEDTDMSRDYEYTNWDQVRKFAETLI
jgi:menaquinone-dependent protoporphyrinogen oxidase